MKRALATPTDVFDLVAAKIRDAHDTRQLAESLFTLVEAKVEPLRTAAANGDRESRLLVGQLDLLRQQLHASTRSERMLSAVEAAERLRLTKPNGLPRDSAYAVVERAGGRKIAGKWTIAEGDLDAYIERRRPMTAIKQLPNGEWYARPTIDKKKGWIQHKRKGEVERQVAQLKDRQRRRRLGLPVEEVRQPNISVTDAVEKFLAQYQRSSRSKKTLTERLKYLTKKLADAHVRDVTTETLLEWNANLAVGQTTRHNAWRAAKQMFGYLEACGYVDANPCVTTQRMPGPAKRKVTPFESWAQVDAVAARAGAKYGPMIRLATATGLRPQELFALEWRHIDVAKRELYIEQTVRDGEIVEEAKTDDSLRTVWLSQRALDALADLPRPIGGGLVFTSPTGEQINPSNFRKRQWRKALTGAKVKYRAFDQCRHSYATLTLATGAPIEWISRQMGHTKIQTTLSRYARWLPRGEERIHALIDGYVENNGTESGQSAEGAR